MPKTLWSPVKPFHPTMNYLDWPTWATSWLNTREAGRTEMASLVEVGIQLVEIQPLEQDCVQQIMGNTVRV